LLVAAGGEGYRRLRIQNAKVEFTTKSLQKIMYFPSKTLQK